MENDKLQKCARAFKKLIDIQYRILLGRKGQLSEIVLNFSDVEFVHLAGLHKLVDNDFLRTASRKKVFEAILNNRLSTEHLEKSENFKFAQMRLEFLEFLEEILDDNKIVFKYSPKKNKFSLIHAAYLMQSAYSSQDIYIFLDKHNDENSYFCRSFFPKESIDYTRGQTSMTLLYKEKINKKTGESIVQYDRIHKNDVNC